MVNNPGFEEYYDCPEQILQLNRAMYWHSPNYGSPDYFNGCSTASSLVDVPANIAGFQYARTGQAYAGVIAYDKTEPFFREYVQTKLSFPLMIGSIYYVTFYVSLADSVGYATDDFGLYLSQDSIYGDNPYSLEYPAQIENTGGNFISNKTAWTKISGTFISEGNEEWLTIGNFKNDIYTDTLGGLGSSPTVFNHGQAAYYFIDDVCVSLDPETCDYFAGTGENTGEENLVDIYPNPSHSVVHVEFSESCIHQSATLILRDLFGKSILTEVVICGQNPILLEQKNEIRKGIYFLSIYVNKQHIIKKIVFD